MAISLNKGERLSLSKEAPNLKKVLIGLGWDARATDGADFDLDASAFLLGAGGKVRSDADFIFYNQLKSACGSVFFTGDAVYDDLLERSLNETKPDIVIANGGSARFLFGQPITMGARDIEKIATLLPESSIVVDHMDAVNHCHESRVDLMNYLSKKEFADRVFIPQDGDVLTYQSGFLR